MTANWRVDAAWAVVALGRDCKCYLGVWFATEVIHWIEHPHEGCQLFFFFSLIFKKKKRKLSSLRFGRA